MAESLPALLRQLSEMGPHLLALGALLCQTILGRLGPRLPLGKLRRRDAQVSARF